MPEITDQQLATLQASEKLLRELMNSAKTKAKAEALVKELHPDVRTTADELEPHLEPVKKLAEKFDAFVTKYETDNADTKFRENYDRVKRDYQLSDDGMQKVLTLMQERTIS